MIDQLDAPVTVLIMAVNIAASWYGLYRSPTMVERFLFKPYWYLKQKRYETAFTSGFLHADLPHLIFNMFTLWAFAFTLEPAMGSAAFAGLYAFGLAMSALGTYVQHQHQPDYRTLGASGAVLAVLFASIVYFPSASLFIMPIPVPIPAPLFAVSYIAYSWYASRQARGRINHDAHLAGAGAGLLYVGLMAPEQVAAAIRHFMG